VSSIPWVQLAVFNVKFSSPVTSTASSLKRRQNSKYPVVRLNVIMLAQSNAGRWSIHICVGSSEQAVSLDSACAISLYRCSITSFPEAWYVVVATVPGHQAAVRVWNRTGRSGSGCYPENRGTQRVRGRVGTGPRFHITVPATLPPIRYLSSDRIVTGSVRKSCIFSPSFTSRCQICDWANIR